VQKRSPQLVVRLLCEGSRRLVDVDCCRQSASRSRAETIPTIVPWSAIGGCRTSASSITRATSMPRVLGRGLNEID
jgi:hypothetical protein